MSEYYDARVAASQAKNRPELCCATTGGFTPSACPHIVQARPCYHGRVSGAKLSVLITVFFFTSVISVVTGSTSLITVPVMIALGIEAHVAVATNMLALTFMSVGGSASRIASHRSDTAAFRLSAARTGARAPLPAL